MSNKKSKKQESNFIHSMENSLLDKKFNKAMDVYGKKMKELLERKDEIGAELPSKIDNIIDIFKRFNSIQLLGGIGLKLYANLPNPEQHFMKMIGLNENDLDEDSEVISEYAMSIGTAIPNDSQEIPSDEDIEKLYVAIKELKIASWFMEMPTEEELKEDEWLTWQTHIHMMNVRGDGYMIFVEEIFKQLFTPHNVFFIKHYGFSIDTLYYFVSKIEERIYSHIGTPYGAYLLWNKMRETGSFDLENPITMYQKDDYENSDKIFKIEPENEEERKLLDALSITFGDNADFIADGEYKGNLMSMTYVIEKPIIKYEENYFCFTPLLLYRNMFLIAETLMKADKKYYDKHFRDNVLSESRDNYIERKVKEQLELFLPNVVFYPSAKYTIVNGSDRKSTELDILGVSDNNVYVIEVKAHELTLKDKAGIKGLKDKFESSVTTGSYQSNRATEYIKNSPNPIFSSGGQQIHVDKSKNIYKIVVTFQHFSDLLGDFNELIKSKLMEENYKDIWIVSLFDLMVIADYTKDESEFIEYLELHKKVHEQNIKYVDELDLYGDFLEGNLKWHIAAKPSMIIGYTDFFDNDYADYLPIVNNK